MKPKTEQTRVYWLSAFVGSKRRNLGIVMVAGADAPECIRGRRIFYRLLRWSEDLIYRRDQSIGFSKAAYEDAKRDGVQYVVTYAEESKQMNIAHIDVFTYEWNKGQGVQKRAYVRDTTTLSNVRGLKYPTAIGRRDVKDEEAMPEHRPPVVTQPSLPGID